MSRSIDLSIYLLFGFAILFVGVNCDFSGWSVRSSDNKICLMVQMDVKTNFTYTTNDKKTVYGQYTVPNSPNLKVTDESKCSDKEDKLVVSWSDGNFSMTFIQGNGSYDLNEFVININVSNVFNNSAANQTVSIKYDDEDKLFKTQGNFSYHCNRDQLLNNTSNNTITISRVQFEAFRSSDKLIFSLAKDCDSNIKPDIVPIAVGLSLIALIIIVLIAYIVGRRRQQARGYLNIM